MTRSQILECLAQAEIRVAEDEWRVAGQRSIVRLLERTGQDPATEKKLLHDLEKTLARHLADLNRLRAVLEEAGPLRA